MNYYNSHGSIILECQNQLQCSIKKGGGTFYHAFINMEKNSFKCLKYSQSSKDYSKVFFKYPHQLS